jgi:integrase
MTKRLDHKALLSDHEVSTWHAEIALRSELSADVELRHVGLFCHLERLTPKELVDLGRDHPGRLRELLIRYAQDLKKRGRLESYVTKTFMGIKSWLRFNRVPFGDFPRLKVIPGESIREERVPTQEELRRILSTYSTRSRVVALFMAHTGVRPGVLAAVDGGDGLRLGDLRDLTLGSSVTFERLPFHVVVPARLSKTSVEYHTFGTPELADALLAYLAARQARGEKLTANSPVVTVDPMGAGTKLRQRSTTGFIAEPVMMRALRDGLKAIVPTARTYVFRAYCSTQMVSARIDRDVREAILGHSLGVSGRYNLSKKLHPNLIEELRREYAKAVPSLESGRPKENRAMALESVVEALLKTRGVSEPKIAEILEGKVSGAELEKILGSRKADPAQRVVPAAGVPALLTQGWEFVSSLGADQAVLRAPANGAVPVPLGSSD